MSYRENIEEHEISIPCKIWTFKHIRKESIDYYAIFEGDVEIFRADTLEELFEYL